MATQVTRKPPTYGNRIFDHGVLSGISWFRQGDTPNVPPTAAMIVEFIKDNMIEFAIDDSLSEEQLRQDVGIVAGFVHRNCIRLDGARKIDYIWRKPMLYKDKDRYQSEEWKEYQRNYQRGWYERHKTKRLALIYERKATMYEYIQDIKNQLCCADCVSGIPRRYTFTT